MKWQAIVLGICLLALVTVAPPVADRLRSAAVALVTVPIKGLVRGSSEQLDWERLEIDNQRLRAQLEFVTRFDRYQELLTEQLEQLDEYTELIGFDQRAEAVASLLTSELQAVPARVLYRQATAWQSAVWIDVGSEYNREAGFPVIMKDSPVVVGSAVVGIVDHVGRRRSRVRLVTDSSCHPAVRAVRGGFQDRELLEHISAVQEVLASRGDLFTTDEAAAILQNNLNILRERLDPTGESCYLVKGNLCGAAQQSWRGGGTLLRGEGFNYDYADAHGPARDLRTGCTADAPDAPGLPLVQQGDLLVTSGLDGVFPEGLAVGRVVEVMPLAEGAYCYELLATAVAGNLSELRYVFVLPPQK